MKDVTNPRKGPIEWRGLARRFWSAALIALLLGALVPGAQAAITLKTLSGGPNATSTNFFGYTDGPINSEGRGPQFSGPGGLTVGGGNNFLLIADRTNNAVRKIDLTSSTLNVTTVTRNGLSNPVDVLLDPAGHLFVLNQGTGAATGRVLMYDSIVFTNLVKTNISGLAMPTAMAMDSSTNLYICVSTGAVFKVSNTATSTVGIVASGTVALRGIVVRDDGKIAVTDAGNHAIWLIDPAQPVGSNVSLLAGVPGSSGSTYGALGLAKFNQPHGLAKAGNNILIVADRFNHRVSVVDSSGTVSNAFGVSSNSWVNVSLPGVYPGWVDAPVTGGSDPDYRGEAREPYGVVVGSDGSIYDTERFYHLIRKATIAGITGPTGGSGGGGSTNGVVVPPPSINPDRGFFPMGAVITVSSSVVDVFYTTDGSDPSTNSTRVTIDSNLGSILWSSTTNDLTKLKLRAFIGTNASVVVSGQPITVSSVGFPLTLNTNFIGGVGAAVIAPIVVNLAAGHQIKSFQLNVHVIATNGAVPISMPLEVMSITTNDFIRLPVPSSDGQTVLISSTNYTGTDAFSNQRSSVAVYNGTGTDSGNMLVQNSAVIALVAIPIPETAPDGSTYILQVRNATATEDGSESELSLTPLADQLITIHSIPFLVGDTSPGRWYNAGDFGNTTVTNITNPDVNNVFMASLAIRKPYPVSDVYAAMDVWPEDVGFPFYTGGDGHITYEDWNVVLQRSLRLPSEETNNWYRAAAGRDSGITVYTNGGTPVALSRPAQSVPPGSVWYRQGYVGAQSLGNKAVNATVAVPLYVKVISGATVSGMQFRAIIKPSPGAPDLTDQATFVRNSNTGVPEPGFKVDLSLQDISRGWVLGALNLTQSSNLLGWIQFKIPASAQQGDSYEVDFTGIGGGHSLQDAYQFESKSGTVWVGTPIAQVDDGISDDWKINFFGAVDAPGSGANDDPDGDGLTNLQEYLAGTDPMSPDSKLEVKIVNGGVQATVQWLSAPGKTYVVESTPTLVDPAWTTVTTVTGDGQYKSVTQSYDGSETRFYRVRVQP